MSLEAQTLSDRDPVAPASLLPPERRCTKDRRKGSRRINPGAPRRSTMQHYAAVAVGVMLGLLLLLIAGSIALLEEPPWIALGVISVALVTAVFSFLVGCLEQRLVEIRLELMMANGGTRESDRRVGSRHEGVAASHMAG